jgi:hypothetical protein
VINKIITMKPFCLFALVLLISAGHPSIAQKLNLNDPYLELDAGPDDPVYTTYAAAMDRSILYGDMAYRMVYHENSEPLYYECDHAGRFYNLWMVNQVAIMNTGEFYQPPRIHCSFPDMVITDYQPVEGLYVQESFLVYSSSAALVNLHMENLSGRRLEIVLFPIIDRCDSLFITGFDQNSGIYEARRYESHQRLISNLYAHEPYPQRYREFLTGNFSPYSYGAYQGPVSRFYNTIKVDHYKEDKYNDTLNRQAGGPADYMALHHKLVIEPGETADVRFIRGSMDLDKSAEELRNEVVALKNLPLQPFIEANVVLFESIPRIDFDSDEERMVYLGAFNLVRGSMLPSSGQTSNNYYVFSRNPKWGWGHGHQVLHESLSMIPYVYLDPVSAQNSQRVYMEQQFEDGLIAYRHGPRGAPGI